MYAGEGVTTQPILRFARDDLPLDLKDDSRIPLPLRKVDETEPTGVSKCLRNM
jgi:hypothetical protein